MNIGPIVSTLDGTLQALTDVDTYVKEHKEDIVEYKDWKELSDRLQKIADVMLSIAPRFMILGTKIIERNERAISNSQEITDNRTQS